MYKIKFSTTKMVYNGQKIKGTHCMEALENMKIEECSYVKECVFLYKRAQQRNRIYTHKSLEMFCSEKITEKSLKKLIEMCKNAGIKGNGIVEVINVKTNEVLTCYNYRRVRKEKPKERTGEYKNKSSYTTYPLYKR